MSMIKTFEQFSTVNEGAVPGFNKDVTMISPESSSWAKAIEYFKKETGKDLSQFKWVFHNNDVQDGIWPMNYVVALMGNSPVLSKYTGLTEYLRDLFSRGDMSYESGYGVDYITPNGKSLSNSKILLNIWTKYFYEPIKRAAETKNFDSIGPEGMNDFEERMHIFQMDFDSDWTNFFASIKLALRSDPGTPKQAPSAQPAAQAQPSKPVAKKATSSGAGYTLPTSFK